MSKRKFSKKEVAISIAAAALAIATVGGAVAIHKDSSKGQSLPFACPYSMGFSRVKVGSYFLRFALKISTLPLTRL